MADVRVGHAQAGARGELFRTTLGEGEGVVLLHGAGVDHSYFRPWLDPLASDVRLLFHDLRGCGRSGPLDDPARVQTRWLDDIDALRDELGAERVLLFGHSQGGFVALRYALDRPSRVAGLILCATTPALDYPDVIVDNAKARGTPEQVEAVLTILSGVADDDALRDIWLRILPLYFHRASLARDASPYDSVRFSARGWNAALGALADYDVSDRLGDVGVPTLVIGGDDDWVMPAEHTTRRLAEGIPAARWVCLEQCGHFPFIERQDAFIAAVRSWLREHNFARGPG